jgi:plastocyanin
MKKYLSLVTICMLFTLSGYSFTQIVNVKNFSFSPVSFTINIGDTIRWVYVSGTHTTTSLTIPAGAAAWDHPINSSSTSFTYVPTKTGTYNYKCTFHFAMGMQGDFTVVCPNASAQISAATSTTFCQGGSVVLNSNVSSSITSYQWKKNGTNISTATAASYTAKSNGAYTLMVTNSCGKAATSNKINVTVNALPGAAITPSGTVSICAGDSIKLKANTGTSNTYIWKRNGVIIPGATSSNYFVKKAGDYKVIVKKTTTGCSKTSAATTVVINCSNAITAKIPDYKIKIFPNPSSNDFHITIPSYNSDRFSLSVYGADGKLVGDKKINSANFLFGSELKPGIYFVEFKNANVVIAKEKIIKK